MERVTSQTPCLICGGHERAQRGVGERCFGFVSDDGEWAHCTREDHAGGLSQHPNSQSYAHKMTGECRCGTTHGMASVSTLITEYDYVDESGKLLSQVVRKHPKSFLQRRPDGAGGWIWNLDGVRRVLFRLPELIKAIDVDRIYLVEGEKDANRIRATGNVATCNPGGVGKWESEFSTYFKGAVDVRIVADNDDRGRKHAREVAESLMRVGVTATLWHSPVGKDVSDLLDAGHDLDELVEGIESEPLPEEETRTEDGAVRLHPSLRDLTPADFFCDGGFIVPKLAQPIQEAGHIKVSIDGRLYRYSGGVYKPNGESFAKTSARHCLGDKFKRRHTDEVLAWLRADEPEITNQPDTERLNVKNGLLNWRTLELHPHTPDYVSVNQLAVAWNPSARCDRFDAFLAEVLPDDAREFAYEVIGYALYAGNPLRVAILLLGPGRNGKTVWLDVITALLGESNVSSVPLQMLSGENQFAAANLFGRLANICGDLDARAVKRTDIFKMVTGGDLVQAERKYRDSFEFRPYALPLFSANEAPISSDQSEAWFDRWIVVPMENRIEPSKVDPHLIRKLTARAELEGVMVQAVKGLAQLMGRGRFNLPASVVQAGENYREHLDTVQGFVAECCVLDPKHWVSRRDLYRAYREWVQEGGRMPLRSAAVYEHLRRGYPDKLAEKQEGGERGWEGIWLRLGHRS